MKNQPKKQNNKPASAPRPTSGRAPKDADIVKSDDGDEDDEEGDEDEGEEDSETEKAELALDDLEKGLQRLEASGRTRKSRKSELLEKAQTETLTSAERKELSGLLEGRSLAKSLTDDEELAKGMDVSPALDSLATSVASAIDGLTARLEKSLDDDGKFNGALADAMISMGSVLRAQQAQIVALTESIEKSLDAPTGAPRAQSREFAKGLDRPSTQTPPTEPKAAQKINTRQLAPVLERMHRDSLEKGLKPRAMEIQHEIAKAVNGLDLDPNMIRDVIAFQKAQG